MILNILVQPRARRAAFGDIVGDCLKVQLTAPPVDGAANEALRALLAKQFRVAKRRVVLERGETGRRKQLRILAPADSDAILERLPARAR